ncbi:MAG TPA: hypothetical protein VF590_26525 [Isosphaeraceae bacterium]|jgi:hypothetical protein
MNRRTALFSTVLLGGLLPRRLLAQGPRSLDREDGRGRRRSPGGSPRLARRSDDELEAPEPIPPEPLEQEEPEPAGFPHQAGQAWRTFDISRYTGLPHSQATNDPQTALVDWIFRRTGSSPWHGEKIAVLGATRGQLRAYHTPKILDQVAEMVERFTDAEADILSVRVRFVAAADPRWRYAVYSRLNPMGSGPHGQQIWSVKVEDAAFVMAQMGIVQGFKPLYDQRVEMVNGQTLRIEQSVRQNYVAGLQRASAVGLGYQPGTQPLVEGIELRLSPLLTYEGDALDAAIDLKATTIRKLHATKVIAPREIGPSEMALDVPEVSETRLNQTVLNWPLDQTLVISAGIHPGILQSKAGFLNLRIPGTVPTTTELLVFLDVSTRVGAPKAAR